MRERFYINSNGEASCRRIYKNKAEKKRIEKQERELKSTQAKEYWDSLTEAQQEIIKWCKSAGLQIAHMRELKLDEFYRKTNNANETPKKVIKYEFVYKHFEEFKSFINKVTQ